ncbi:MAG TPA: hypothetical protein VGO50_06715 [Pyrinomonadaceae bacterium]|jgi:hypothetical protein|nr:hypothetical protein [Pyrinomonadaceae bacterium]
MATNVEIFIKGLALWFKRDDCWNALLYFDDCHLVDVSHGPADEPPVLKQSLARPNGKIKIDIQREPAAVTSTTSFNTKILNLTSKGAGAPYLTHNSVEIRSDWATKAVHLRLGNAELSVSDYIEELTDDPILLHGERIQLQRFKSLGHWVKAKIRVPEGKMLDIQLQSDITSIPGTTAETGYRIVINNDCSRKSLNNDMFRYYDLIKGLDAAGREEKFWVGKRLDQSLDAIIEQRTQAQTEEVDVSRIDMSFFILLYIILTGGTSLLLEGKPCMSVQASDVTNPPPFTP